MFSCRNSIEISQVSRSARRAQLLRLYYVYNRPLPEDGVLFRAHSRDKFTNKLPYCKKLSPKFLFPPPNPPFPPIINRGRIVTSCIYILTKTRKTLSSVLKLFELLCKVLCHCLYKQASTPMPHHFSHPQTWFQDLESKNIASLKNNLQL